jgi:hypothetical protein
MFIIEFRMKHLYNDISKYLEQVDLIEYNITKNICKLIKNKKDKKIIYNNLFLLGINNKNNKTSLEILLENYEYNEILELINYDYKILDYKNNYETNLITKLLEYNFFYDKLNEILTDIIKNDILFKIKILSEVNVNNENFIDKIISIINLNENNYNIENNKKNNKIKINDLIEVIKTIYLLEKEDKFFLITKITKEIVNEEILKYIFSFINFKNFDIYPDENLMTCIDYLIINYNLEILNNIIDNINYIYFVNIDKNSILLLLEEFMNNKIDYLKLADLKKLIKLIFKILEKSNILNIKNNKNQNIFFIILKLIKIDYKVLSKYIKDQKIDIFDQDINGDNLFKIIKSKYNYKEIEYIFNNYHIKLKNKIDNNNNNIITKLYRANNINLNKLLIKSDIGIFTADVLHNILYTIIFLEKYKNLEIPYFFQNNNYFNNEKQLIELSNNDKYLNSLLRLYFFNFNFILPHIIIWKNKNNYFMDKNLLNWIINNKKIEFIYIKLSINLLNIENSRHANLIIIDNKNKIVERFEPYGEINYYNSIDLNNFIINNISNPINYQFKFIQSFPGFQTRSDDINVFNKTYGDPFGYCLAWCFLYLEIRMIINNNIKPIDVINNFVINQFKNDNIDNIYISFIRYYAVGLDSQKNELLKRYNIDPAVIYHNHIDNKKYSIIINKLNNELLNIIKNKN